MKAFDNKTLPQGWRAVTLEAVTSNNTKKIVPHDHPELPFIGMDSIQSNSMIVERLYRFGDFKSAGNAFKFDQVLYGRMRPYLNKVFHATYAGACSGEFIVLDCEAISPKYLTFLMHSRSFVRFANSKTNGDRPRISFDEIKEFEILIPPIAEQHRIVAKIEELFASLDKGIETLKTTKQRLKVYRQAVLKYAFEGRLTNPDLKEGELPEGWELRKLLEIGKWTGGGTPSKSNTSYWTNGGILWVTPKDMKTDLILSTEDRITATAVEESSAKIINSNSVLIVVRSGILRRTLPVSYVEQSVTVNQDMQAITPHSMNHKYLFYALKANSEDIRRTCSKDGTTVESIETSILKSFKIVDAPLEVQSLLIQEIESRLAVCDKIEESIEQSLGQAEALRQSILKKAFEGNLVPQDPNDEPASVLLERIRAERQRNNVSSKRRIKAN